MPRSATKAAAARLRKADEINRALDLRRRAMTMRDISRIMGRSLSYVHRLVDEGVKSIPAETRDALVHEIHERELGIIRAHWPQRKDPDSAKVIQASDKLLVDLLGLSAPKAVSIGATAAEGESAGVTINVVLSEPKDGTGEAS